MTLVLTLSMSTPITETPSMGGTRYVILLLFFCGFLSHCGQPAQVEQAAPTKPNILIILADDMGYGDLKCYNNNSKINTQHIDRLAKEGMRFTDAHAPAAVCVPSRYSLLTGHYPFLNKRKYTDGIIEPGRATIATILKQAGYQTGMVGKWHQGIVSEKAPAADTDLLGGPLDHGFDDFFGMPASLDIPPYYYIKNKRPLALPTADIAAMEGTAPAPGQRKIQGPFYRGGKVAPDFKHEEVLDRFGQEAVSYIEAKAQQEQPFFLYLALPAPHTPWLPSEAFAGKSQAGDYGDFVLQVDHVVGQLTQTLANLKVADNTLIFFSSDNGPVWYPENVDQYQHQSVGQLSGMKGDALEGGHRLPFIAKWPGHIKAGAVDSNLICFTDLLATFADLTDTPLAENQVHNSQSILPLLINQASTATRSTLVMQSSGRKFAVRKGDWKLILAKGSGGFTDRYDPSFAEGNTSEGRLYNLKTDIGEKINLYEENPEKVAELRSELDALLMDSNQ